ncbi:MAG: PilZ domain-containing protein, partial [Polyangiaceae bacterium]
MSRHENLALLRPILYRGKRTEEEMNTEERRTPGATRIPFEAMVEVGGALGPTFEAQAVNVSEDGIQLRTAYLPEIGQPLTCRFDGGPGHVVLAAGEVAWAQGAERGGEFGVRFTEVDAESLDALRHLCGIVAHGGEVQAGSKVRLHIEGLASPMRAKVKDARRSEVTVGSDLGFLQVGRQLELEDAQNGVKRPAHIDRVEVAVDPTSKVPQLIVTLRYTDDPELSSPRDAAGHGASPAPARAATVAADDLAAVERVSRDMKGMLARGIEAVGPIFGRVAERAKTMAQVLGERRRERADGHAGAKRTTAPAPGGGLHTSGRRVVRGPDATAADAGAEKLGLGQVNLTRRRAALAAGVMLAAVVTALAMKKMHHESPAPAAPAAAAVDANAAPLASAASSAPSAAAPMPVASSAAPQASAAPPVEAESDAAERAAHHRRIHVPPFSNGPVHHGNVLRLKMDGPIETIEGAQQPTGFAVKIPGRKALEAAAPLAARDGRIAAIKVSNEGSGANLTVAFK